MDKLISQQAAIDALCKSECGWNNAECRHKDGTDFCVTCDNVKIIKFLPSIHSEHKTGQWIPDNTDYYRTKFICSACGESEEVPTTGFGYGTMWDYCPNCGAKMERGEQK